MSQASSNSNMPRSTVEALKQIQKQGLSISVVSGDSPRTFSLDTPVSKETRSKQNVMVDKTPKVTPRTSVASDTKNPVPHTRSSPNTAVETRVSSGQSLGSNQCIFQESKTSGNHNRTNQAVPKVSDNKAFVTQTWSNQNSSMLAESKSQGNSSRLTQNISVLPENKNQGNTTRLCQNSSSLPETKPQTSRNVTNSSVLPENKNQRINQMLTSKDKLIESKGQAGHVRISQTHPLLTEGKISGNQSRMSLNTSSSETKVFSSQVMSSSNFTSIENKSGGGGGGLRNISHLLTDSKASNQSKMTPNRAADTKISNQNRGNQLKLTSDNSSNSQIRIRQSFIKTSDGKNITNHSSGTFSSSSESIKTTTSRQVSNIDTNSSRLEKKFSNTSEGKSVVKVTRLAQNVSFAESPSALHTKVSQNFGVQSENKVIGQVVKISSVTSDMSQKSSLSFDDGVAASPVNPASLSRVAVKRTPTTGPPVAKKKCTKRNSPSAEQTAKLQCSSEVNTLSSSDEGSPDGKKYFNLKNLTPAGLTITPVPVNTVTAPTPSTSVISQTLAEPVTPEKDTIVVCQSCKHISRNPNFCENCKSSITPALLYHIQNSERKEKVAIPFLVTKNVTTSISKQIVYQLPTPELMNQSFHFQQSMQGKFMIEASPMLQTPPRSKGRPRRKYSEPVCLTLSSDDEDPVQDSFTSFSEEMSNASHFFQAESDGSKSEQSSPSELCHDESQESDEPQFPGVTNINEKQEEDELEYDDRDEEMEYEDEEEEIEEEEEECSIEEEEEEDEEVPPEEESNHEENMHSLIPYDKLSTEHPLKCRSVRIGSLKVHPTSPNSVVPVFLKKDMITFHAPLLTDSNKLVTICLKPTDVTMMLLHFGRCLPIVFVFTTTSFADSVRKLLNMTENDIPWFDPTSTDDKQKKITFLIDSMIEEQRRYFRQIFPGEQKIQEIDQKTANEILVKSTPHQNSPVVKPLNSEPITGYTSIDNQMVLSANIPQVCSLPQQLSVIKVQPLQPVVKVLTYPPPPQTGGIAITSEDVACLNDGEFLNDAIIDFYLKYVFYEKLSDYHREKTHIFSSFFYPRLTHKPERPRPGDDGAKTMQVRRHSQVKTWTRHVDIFSKDYIIIPVNQNVHWFLAIICYPGCVPEATNVPKLDPNTSKSADSVTSTDDQEDSNKSGIKDPNCNAQNQDENSMTSSNNSLCEGEEPLDCMEPIPEAPDSSTHPDGKHKRKETPCICIFDSLSGPNRWRIASTLREYLEMEWKQKKKTPKVFDRYTMQGYIIKCPQQTNYSDCGLYLLQYVESFFENPIPYFASPMPDLTNWFSEMKITKKRQQIKELIINLQKKQSANSAGTSGRKVKQLDGVPSSPATVQQTDNR